jgi:TIR domain
MVLQSVTPWLSQADIAAGDRWADKIAKELEVCNFGVICVTRENIASPWVLFEAGALAKLMQEGRVIPLLLDIEFKDVAGPLAQFQAKKVEKDGLSDVINSINKQSDIKVSDTQLPKQFEALWPQLEKRISEIPKNPTPAKQHRPQQEILEELVSSIRGLDLRFRDIADEGPRGRRRRYRVHPMMFEEMLHRLELSPRDPMRFLIFSSVLREDFPWVYELGAEAYRASVSGPISKAKEAQQRFIAAVHVLRRGPFLEMAGDKESHMFLRELVHLVEEMTIPEPTEESNDRIKVSGRTGSRPTDDGDVGP